MRVSLRPPGSVIEGEMMNKHDENKTVERSRLALLGGLTAAAAGGGCTQTTEAVKKRPVEALLTGRALNVPRDPDWKVKQKERERQNYLQAKENNRKWRKEQKRRRAAKTAGNNSYYPEPSIGGEGGEGGGGH